MKCKNCGMLMSYIHQADNSRLYYHVDTASVLCEWHNLDQRAEAIPRG